MLSMETSYLQLYNTLLDISHFLFSTAYFQCIWIIIWFFSISFCLWESVTQVGKTKQFFFYNIVLGELKMMKIFGMVEKVDIQSGNIISNKECVDNCFEQEDCILAFMNLDDYCVLLGFNQTEHLTVLENTRAERYMVAFKVSTFIYRLKTLPSDNSSDR